MPETTAIVGAVTGVLGLLFSLFQEFRHRRQERLDKPALRMRAAVGIEGVQFKIVNAGRRRVSVRALRSFASNGYDETFDVRPDRALPRTLEENDALVLTVPLDSRTWSDVTSVFLVDSLDNKWPLPSAELEAVVRKAGALTRREGAAAAGEGEK